MMKLLRNILVVMLLLIVGVVLARNYIVKAGVEKGVEAATGLPLRLKSVDIGIRTTHIDIQGLQLMNPEGFVDPIMADIPEIYVDYNLEPLLQNKVYLNEVRFHFKEFVIVEDKDGRQNLDSLKALQKEEEPKKPEVEKEEDAEKAEEELDLRIDRMKLRIDRVVYKDYSKGGDPDIQVFEVNIDEEFANITDINELVSLIVFKAIAKTTLKSVVNVAVDSITDIPGDVLKDSILGETKDKIKDVLFPF